MLSLSIVKRAPAVDVPPVKKTSPLSIGTISSIPFSYPKSTYVLPSSIGIPSSSSWNILYPVDSAVRSVLSLIAMPRDK